MSLVIILWGVIHYNYFQIKATELPCSLARIRAGMAAKINPFRTEPT